MAQVLLIALAVTVLVSITRLALAFVQLLAKLLAAGIVFGAALSLIAAVVMHGHLI